MSKELKERLVNKAHATVEGLVNKASAAVEEIALQVVQDEVESPHMLGIDNARFLYEVRPSAKLPYFMPEVLAYVRHLFGATKTKPNKILFPGDHICLYNKQPSSG